MIELEGLAGAHRVGKTTLCEKVSSSEPNREFVLTSAASVFKKYGHTPRDNFSPAKRLELQDHILDTFVPIWADEDISLGITDRTPLDLLAYTLCDIRRHVVGGEYNLTQELRRNLCEYITRCYSCLNSLFSSIVIIQPGIPIIDDAKSAIPDVDYIDELNSVINELASNTMCTIPVFVMPSNLLDLDDREKFVLQSRRLYRHATGVIDDTISRRLEEIS